MEETSKPCPQEVGKRHVKFSEEIKTLLEQLIDRPLTVAEILAETEERGFSLMIGLLVLPFLFPLPPGFTTVLGGGSLLLAVQMALGRRSPWLPKKIAQFRFPQKLAQQMLNPLKRMSRWLENIARPRWSQITRHPRIWQINGLCISWLAVLLMSPIPFTNPAPTVGILAFVIATLEEDGLLLCVSYGLTVLNTVFFGVLGYLLWRSPELVRTLLENGPSFLQNSGQ
ncbi:MAG TPA: exopolysaccharide biosynthesis protein [Leptolyngbyaceae cyanobacterium]